MGGEKRESCVIFVAGDERERVRERERKLDIIF